MMLLPSFFGAYSQTLMLVLNIFMSTRLQFAVGYPANTQSIQWLKSCSSSYLPNDIRWRGFRIDEERAVIITPTGLEFSPKELESFAYAKDEYQQMIELHGHMPSPIYRPAKENVLPFRGGRRMQAAPWIPSKLKR
ncbi:hypothetical protein GCM10026988_18850 [Vibrio panuliri]